MEREISDIYPSYWPWGRNEWTDYLMELWSPLLKSGIAGLEGVEFSETAQAGDELRKAMRFRLLFSSMGMDYTKGNVHLKPEFWKGTGD